MVIKHNSCWHSHIWKPAAAVVVVVLSTLPIYNRNSPDARKRCRLCRIRYNLFLGTMHLFAEDSKTYPDVVHQLDLFVHPGQEHSCRLSIQKVTTCYVAHKMVASVCVCTRVYNSCWTKACVTHKNSKKGVKSQFFSLFPWRFKSCWHSTSLLLTSYKVFCVHYFTVHCGHRSILFSCCEKKDIL